MIEIKKEELLKDSIDYEDYSDNVYKLSVEELRENGLLKCNGCCSKKKDGQNKKQCCKNIKKNESK